MSQHKLLKRESLISAFLSILFIFFLINGWRMETGNTNYFLLFLFPIIYFFVYKSWGVIYSKSKLCSVYSFSNIPSRFILQFVMILCWIPVLLAAYPGFFCYDATYQFNQALSGEYNLRHPLLHTIFLGKTLVFVEKYSGSYDLGVLLYCIVQMLIITGCFCAVIKWMEKQGTAKWFLILSFIYYCIYPICVLFGLCTTKDGLFTACMMMHLMYLFELIQKKEAFIANRQKTAAYIATAVFAMLLRNNGVFSFLIFLPLLVLLAKGIRKKVLLLSMTSIFLFLIISKGLTLLYDAQNRDGLREVVSIPIQQLARTYNIKGESFFSEEDRNILYELIDEKDLNLYQDKLSDPVKTNLRVGMNKSILKFGLLWIKTGVRAPDIYFDAFILQTYQAWYPFTIPDGYCGKNAQIGYENSESCLFAADVEPPAIAHSKIPPLSNIYKYFSRHMTFQTLPVIPILFSIGTVFWILLYMLGYALCFKKKAMLGILTLILCTCLTCLLGPISLVRYYLILYFALPLMIGSCQFKETDINIICGDKL